MKSNTASTSTNPPRNNESNVLREERQFLRWMLLERLREKHPDAALPPMNSPLNQQALSPENYDHYKALLEHIREVLQDRFYTVKIIRCEKFHTLSPSRRRLTVIGGPQNLEPIFSVSSNQVRELFKPAIAPDLSDEKPGLNMKNTFLNGLYLYITQGRFYRNEYRERYPRLFIHQTEEVSGLLFQIKTVIPPEVPKSSLPEYIQNRSKSILENLDSPVNLAGELLFRANFWFDQFVYACNTAIFPAAFILAIRKFLHHHQQAKAEKLIEIDQELKLKKQELHQLEREILQRKYNSETTDWGFLDMNTDVAPFLDHLKILVKDGLHNLDQAQRAINLMKASMNRIPSLTGFRFLEQVNDDELKQLIQVRKQSNLKYRYYGLYNFRPGARVNVWLCWDVLNNCFVILKYLVPTQLSEDKEKRFKHEVNIARRLLTMDSELKGRSISERMVRLLETGSNWFVIEYVEGGDLAYRRRPRSVNAHEIEPRAIHLFGNGNPFPRYDCREGWPQLRDFFIELADTISLLSEKQLTHREICPSNILLKKTVEAGRVIYHPIICDLDRVVDLGAGTVPDHLTDQFTTTGFQAPENTIAPNRKYPPGSDKADVYSLGAILAYQFLGQAYNQNELRRRITESNLSAPLRRLIKKTLTPHPEKRPSAAEFANELSRISRPTQTIRPMLVLVLSLTLPLVMLLGAILNKYHISNTDHSYDNYQVIDQKYVQQELQDRDTLRLYAHSARPYLFRENVRIDSGKVLHIDPGVTLQFDSLASLYIRPTAKIFAEGTSMAPIVFTSRQSASTLHIPQPGYWGGIIIQGQSHVYTEKMGVSEKNRPTMAMLEFCNIIDQEEEYCRFGGSYPEDNSGILRHVIIENGGAIEMIDREINALNLAGVGLQTQVEHITIRNSQDDGIEIFGGTVNLSHLQLFNSRDDAIDISLGYEGKIEEVWVLIDDSTLLFPNYAAETGKNIIEIDSKSESKLSRPILSHVTALNLSGIKNPKEHDISFAPIAINGIQYSDTMHDEIRHIGFGNQNADQDQKGTPTIWEDAPDEFKRRVQSENF